VVAEQEALLQPFCPEVTPNWRRLRRLERKLDRQRRANNPDYYDERGRIKKGRKRWKISKRQRKVQARRREVYRVLALGNTFQLRADLLPGVAETVRPLGRTQCPWDVRLAPVSPG
jgi:hypothetical protein